MRWNRGIKQLMFGLLFVSVFCTGCANQDSESNETNTKQTIMTGKPEDVVAFQVNTLKVAKEDYSKTRWEEFLESMETMVPLEEGKTVQRGTEYADYMIISLIYKDDNRDNYYFFPYDQKWYMETMDGRIYQNADFIIDYIGIDLGGESTVSSSGASITAEPEELRVMLELQKEFGKKDLSDSLEYYFAQLFYQYQKQDELLETEAAEEAKEEILKGMRVWQYANDHGCYTTDEEVDEFVEQMADGISKSEEYEDQKVIFDEVGITLEEFLENNKELYRYHLMMINISGQCQEAFRMGNDEIQGVTYDTYDDYERAFFNEIENSKDYDLRNMEKELDDLIAAYVWTD